MKNTSLKSTIIKVLILFTIVITLVVGITSMILLYESKIQQLKYNQLQVVKQLEIETQKFLDDIQEKASYLNSNYFLHKGILKNIVDFNKNINTILILDNKGTIFDYYSSKEKNIYKGFDYSNQVYFKNINSQNEKFWSDVFFSTVDEEHTLTFSFRMSKDFVGVFFIKLNELASFCKRYKNSDGSYMIRIFDKKGIILLNPDNPQIVLQYYNLSKASIYNDLINKNQPYEQDKFYSLKNIKQIGMYTNIKEVGWKIVVREKYELLIQSIKTVLISILFSMIIFIFTAIFIAINIAKSIFNTVKKVSNNISEISAGNYDVSIEESPYEEFDSFTKSFEHMQAKIKRREISLEKSLNTFKSLFNSTMESIFLTKNGVILDVNNITVKLFNAKSRKDLIGKNIFNFIDSNYHKVVESKLSQSVEPYEIELISVDKKNIQALVQDKIIEFEGEKIRLSAVIDITELKQKDQLIFQQSKMASMGEMIGNIAHQWRQPLNTISTCASGIKFEKEFGVLDENNIVHTMDTIVENTQFLSKTIDDFRNFFKSDKSIDKFVIKDVIEQSLKLLNASLKNHEIEVVKNYLDENFSYEGVTNEFIQVIINIINNSKDAFKDKVLEKKVIYINEKIKSDKYILEIKDNAGGIPPDIIDKVFDPYFTTKHKSQGTGIGLYMSHQIIVDHMSGNISAKNIFVNVNGKVNKGAKFKIELPLEQT